jgi:hypothetical protein
VRHAEAYDLLNDLLEADRREIVLFHHASQAQHTGEDDERIDAEHADALTVYLERYAAVIAAIVEPTHTRDPKVISTEISDAFQLCKQTEQALLNARAGERESAGRAFDEARARHDALRVEFAEATVRTDGDRR